MNFNLKQKIEIILTVGQVLAENGASTDRVIRSSKRVAEFMKIPEENFNMQVTPSAIFLNVFEDERSNISSRNCEKNAVDMNLVTLISNFTKNALEKNYSQKKFQDILDNIISRKKLYSHMQIIFATGIFCGGLCFLFGGDIIAAIYTAICSAVGKFFQLKLSKLGVNHFAVISIAAFVVTFLAYFAYLLPTETMATPIIACTLFLIPGVPIINAIIDILNDCLLNGITKAFRATLITISMTVGIVFAVVPLAFYENVNPTIFTKLALTSIHNFFEISVAGIVTAFSFSILINMPKRLLIILGVLGMISVITKNFFISELNFSLELGTFLGAVLVGILIIKVRKITRTPMQVLILPAIIPLVPGVLMYRFLFSCLNIEHLNSEEFFQACGTGIDSLQIIFVMTIAATFPSLIANKLFEKKS